VAGNDDKTNPTPGAKGGDIGEAFDLVKAYARQETVDPLKSVGKYLGWAVPGALLLAVGWLFLLIGLLRVLQTEIDTFDGGWSFVPYFIVFVTGVLVLGLFIQRVRKGDLRG
jgi:hypothetical protein